jgi:signal peptidase II
VSAGARAWARAAALAALVVVCDQATKQLAASRLDAGEDVALALGFELAEVHNRGIAFGLLGDGQSLVIVITLAALALVLAYFARDPARPGLWVGIGLLAGGALGNLADRAREDFVIDFLDPPAWPAFNLADVAIVAGIATIVLMQMRSADEPTPDAKT